LPYGANLGRMEFSETTGRAMNENDDRRNAPKEPDRVLAEITRAMKTLPDAELLDLLAAVKMGGKQKPACLTRPNVRLP
jgi:hypothetical protein